MSTETYIKLFQSNQISRHTRRLYNQELHRFFQFVELGIEDITITHVLEYRNSIMNLNPITVSWKMSVLRSFFSFLTMERIIPHNPAQNVKSPRVRKHPHYPKLNTNDLQKMLPEPKGFYNLRNRCILQFMGQLGLRVSEVCGLTFEHIDNDLEYPTLLIMGKGNVVRTVPFINGVKEELYQYLSYYPANFKHNAPLFPASRNNLHPMTTRAVQYIVKSQCKKANLSNQISPHTLRHLALSVLYRESKDLFLIQNFAGHRNLATTSQYVHKLNQEENYKMKIFRIKSLIGKMEVMS